MAADARGAESTVDVDVDAIRQAENTEQNAVAVERSQVEPPVETTSQTPQQGAEHTATVIDLRTAEPIVEIDHLTDSGLAKASTLQLGVKRAVDITVSMSALIVLMPLFIVVAAAIKLSSKGPVFFKQPRVGRLGEDFKFYKFRSMRTTAVYEKPQLRELNEKDGPIFKIKNDPRITRVGRVIRKLSIDELPQLAHVLSGKMSLVGPRPHLPEEVAAYDARAARRLAVKPGITCIWQVSGRADLDFDTWIDLDLEYIDTWSLGLDAKLLVKTVPAVLSGKGAY
ncbi:MAG: sugar transferase [Acidimicrobiia bacterium]|nr:sugar transferase [Acidimicrobiia bacterium]